MTTKQPTKRRFVPDFDARSLMIIAAWTLAMAGSGAVYAQTPPPPPSPASPGAPMTSPGGGGSPGGMSSPSGGEKAAPAPGGAMDPPPAPMSKKETDAAFDRADANHDGKLTRNEAASIPGLSERFDQIDKDHKGSITKSQFESAVMHQ